MGSIVAATFRSPHLGTNNEAVITFALDNDPGSNEVKDFAARIAAAHRALTAFNVMARSEMVAVTARKEAAGSTAINIAIDNTRYLTQLGELNLDPTVNQFFGAGPVQPTSVAGGIAGEALYLPIGTSIMVTESTPVNKGRAFLPFPSYYGIDLATGKCNQYAVDRLDAVWRWLHDLTPAAAGIPSSIATQVWSSKNQVFTPIIAIKVKSEFSNLASRRR